MTKVRGTKKAESSEQLLSSAVYRQQTMMISFCCRHFGSFKRL